MKRYVLARAARADLLEIWKYLAEHSGTEVADEIVDSVIDRFPFVADHPEAGRSRAELGASLRSFPADPYIVYYFPLARRRIRVARVVHGMSRSVEGLAGTLNASRAIIFGRAYERSTSCLAAGVSDSR